MVKNVCKADIDTINKLVKIVGDALNASNLYFHVAELLVAFYIIAKRHEETAKLEKLMSLMEGS